jgi:DNA repair exonuclease SbcCD ATPase subunit
MEKSFTWIFFEEKFKALEKALELQAKEYERRLEDLNGEAGRLKAMKQELASREVFDRTIDELRKELKVLSEWKTKQEGKSQLTMYIPWIIAIISIVIMYTKK